MEQEIDNNELVTKGYLHQELGNFRSEVNRKFAHHDKNFEFVFKKLLEHDEHFERMEDKLDKTISIIQGMADKVTKSYEIFMAASASIHFNYQHLEARTTKLEEVVFPRP